MPHPKVLSTKRLWTEQIFTFLSSFQALKPVQRSKIWTRSILMVYFGILPDKADLHRSSCSHNADALQIKGDNPNQTR